MLVSVVSCIRRCGFGWLGMDKDMKVFAEWFDGHLLDRK